jgi:hypothetical protein
LIFITVVWIMVLTVTAFLVVLVAPIDFALFGEKYDRLVNSVIKAFIAITTVMLFILGLNRLKRFYIQKKLEIK